MKISEIETGQRNVEVKGEVVDMGEIREFSKFGREGRVCNAIIQDDSGKMQLTLWNEEVDKIIVGDKVKVSNGYVKEYQGEKQISAGRYGSLEVV